MGVQDETISMADGRGFTDEELATPADKALLYGTDDSEQQTEGEEQQSDEVQETDEEQEEATTDSDEATNTDESDEAKDDTQEPVKPDDKADDKKSDTVPAARLSKVTHERNALKEQLAALQAQFNTRTVETEPEKQEPKKEALKLPEFDFDEKEQEYEDALLLGETDNARAIRKEINKARIAEQTIREQIQEEKILAKAEERIRASEQKVQNDKSLAMLNQAAAEVVKLYPFLNSNLPDSNKEAIDEVLEFRDVYFAKGMTPAQALLKAVERVAPLYITEKATTTTKPASKEREKEALAKSVKIASQIPPRPGNNGVGNKQVQNIDIKSLSQEDYEKLSAAERRKLMGG